MIGLADLPRGNSKANAAIILNVADPPECGPLASTVVQAPGAQTQSAAFQAKDSGIVTESLQVSLVNPQLIIEKYKQLLSACNSLEWSNGNGNGSTVRLSADLFHVTDLGDDSVAYRLVLRKSKPIIYDRLLIAHGGFLLDIQVNVQINDIERASVEQLAQPGVAIDLIGLGQRALDRLTREYRQIGS